MTKKDKLISGSIGVILAITSYLIFFLIYYKGDYLAGLSEPTFYKFTLKNLYLVQEAGTLIIDFFKNFFTNIANFFINFWHLPIWEWIEKNLIYFLIFAPVVIMLLYLAIDYKIRKVDKEPKYKNSETNKFIVKYVDEVIDFFNGDFYLNIRRSFFDVLIMLIALKAYANIVSTLFVSIPYRYSTIAAFPLTFLCFLLKSHKLLFVIIVYIIVKYFFLIYEKKDKKDRDSHFESFVIENFDNRSNEIVGTAGTGKTNIVVGASYVLNKSHRAEIHEKIVKIEAKYTENEKIRLENDDYIMEEEGDE